MPQWIAPVGAEAIFFPGQGLAEQMVYLQGEAGFGISTGSFVKSDFTTPEVSIKEGDRWYFRYTVEGDGNAHNVTRVVAHTGGLLASIDQMYTQVAGEFVLAGGLTGNPMGGANPVFGASVVFNAWAPVAQSFVGVLSGRAANNGGGTATLSLSYTIPEVMAVGTLKLESAQDVGGGYREGALASDPVVPGLKVAAPERFNTGVTFTGTSFPAAQPLPDDDASGWTSFGAGQNLSFQVRTPNAGIPAGTITCWIIRYDLQTAAGEHVGYLYKQAYYTAAMVEVGTNSHSIHVWYRSSGTELLTGPQTQSSLRTWAMDRIVEQ